MGNIKDIYTSLILHIISQMLENSLSEILIKCGLNLVGEITPENAIRVGKEAIHECGISLKFERLRKLYAHIAQLLLYIIIPIMMTKADGL